MATYDDDLGLPGKTYAASEIDHEELPCTHA